MCTTSWIAKRDGLADAAMRQPHIGGQDTMRQAGERLLGGVRVDGAQAAEMTGVERLQQVERFRATHLANQDAIRPVAKRGAEQVGNRDRRQRRFLSERRLRAPCFEPKHVRFVQMNLGRLLDQTITRSRSGMCAASALSSVVLPVPVPPEIRMFCCVAIGSHELGPRSPAVSAPTSHQVVEAVPARELPDGQGRPGDSARREHRRHPRAVLEARVQQRLGIRRSRRRTPARCS